MTFIEWDNALADLAIELDEAVISVIRIHFYEN